MFFKSDNLIVFCICVLKLFFVVFFGKGVKIIEEEFVYVVVVILLLEMFGLGVMVLVVLLLLLLLLFLFNDFKLVFDLLVVLFVLKWCCLFKRSDFFEIIWVYCSVFFLVSLVRLILNCLWRWLSFLEWCFCFLCIFVVLVVMYELILVLLW